MYSDFFQSSRASSFFFSPPNKCALGEGEQGSSVEKETSQKFHSERVDPSRDSPEEGKPSGKVKKERWGGRERERERGGGNVEKRDRESERK